MSPTQEFVVSDAELMLGFHERIVRLEEELEVAYAQQSRARLCDKQLRRLNRMLEYLSPRPWLPRIEQALEGEKERT